MARHDKIFDGETSRRSLLGDGRFALGVLVGVAIILATYLILSALGKELSRKEAIDLVPAVVALMVAIVSLLISFQVLNEQRKMRQAGTDPVLIAHLSGRKDQPTLIMLRFSNVGAGAATNVRVSISDNAWPELLGRTLLKHKNFNKPFMAILQGEHLEYPLHVSHKLLGNNPLSPFNVTLKYEDIDGGVYRSEQRIDLQEISGQSVTSPAETKVVDALEKIQKDIGHFASGSKSLGVVTERREDSIARERQEENELRAQLEEVKKQDKE